MLRRRRPRRAGTGRGRARAGAAAPACRLAARRCPTALASSASAVRRRGELRRGAAVEAPSLAVGQLAPPASTRRGSARSPRTPRRISWARARWATIVARSASVSGASQTARLRTSSTQVAEPPDGGLAPAPVAGPARRAPRPGRGCGMKGTSSLVAGEVAQLGGQLALAPGMLPRGARAAAVPPTGPCRPGGPPGSRGRPSAPGRSSPHRAAAASTSVRASRSRARRRCAVSCVAPLDLGQLVGHRVGGPQPGHHAEHAPAAAPGSVGHRGLAGPGRGLAGVGDDVGEDPPHLLVGGLPVDRVDRGPDRLVAQDAAVDDELGAPEVGPAGVGGPAAVGQLDGTGRRLVDREGLERGRERSGAAGGDRQLRGHRLAAQVAPRRRCSGVPPSGLGVGGEVEGGVVVDLGDPAPHVVGEEAAASLPERAGEEQVDVLAVGRGDAGGRCGQTWRRPSPARRGSTRRAAGRAGPSARGLRSSVLSEPWSCHRSRRPVRSQPCTRPRARKPPLMPPALVPAMTSMRASACSDVEQVGVGVRPASAGARRRLACTRRFSSWVTPLIQTARLTPPLRTTARRISCGWRRRAPALRSRGSRPRPRAGSIGWRHERDMGPP